MKFPVNLKFPWVSRAAFDLAMTNCDLRADLIAAYKEQVAALQARIAELETGTTKKASDSVSTARFRWGRQRATFEANTLREANTPRDTSTEIEKRGDQNVSHNQRA